MIRPDRLVLRLLEAAALPEVLSRRLMLIALISALLCSASGCPSPCGLKSTVLADVRSNLFLLPLAVAIRAIAVLEGDSGAGIGV